MIDEDEIEELRELVWWQNRRRILHSYAPDCRDPEHRGCERCMDEGDEE